jgi:hypothetical protein
MAGSFTGSPAKQERSTAHQTDQRANDKTYGAAGLITPRTEEFKSQPDEEVRSQDEANDGEDYSNKEHGENAEKDRDYSINHLRFSSDNCQFQRDASGMFRNMKLESPQLQAKTKACRAVTARILIIILIS